MRTSVILAVFMLLCSTTASAQANFDRYFEDATLRIDYHHTGTVSNEQISLDQVYVQPLWAGSRINLVDTLNLGKYLVKVIDPATNRLIYSRGYSSIYGEYETTLDARNEIFKTFHESVLVPLPRRRIQLIISKRDERMNFKEIFTTAIDAGSRFVNRERPSSTFKAVTLHESGPVSECVDYLLLGDGFTENDLQQYRADIADWRDVILKTAPFNKYKNRINIRAIEVISQDSGIDEPRKNIWKNTALSTSYNSLDSPRYVLTLDNKAMRDIAAQVPYDFIYILVNSDRYGGGGIYNLYATGMNRVKNPDLKWHIEYMFTHEFGHSFAGLGDEYYSSSSAYLDFYAAGVEPWEPNVTALIEPEKLKWKAFCDADTPLPTTWAKAKYDSLEGIRRTWDRSKEGYYEKWKKLRTEEQAVLMSSPYAGKVGAFEGAGYSSTGLYRPFIDCRMFSLNMVPFDPVCGAAIEKVIKFYSN